MPSSRYSFRRNRFAPEVPTRIPPRAALGQLAELRFRRGHYGRLPQTVIDSRSQIPSEPDPIHFAEDPYELLGPFYSSNVPTAAAHPIFRVRRAGSAARRDWHLSIRHRHPARWIYG